MVRFTSRCAMASISAALYACSGGAANTTDASADLGADVVDIAPRDALDTSVDSAVASDASPDTTDASAQDVSPDALAADAQDSAPSDSATDGSASGWVTVIDDEFESGGVPSHWSLYDGPYGSTPNNWAIPSHVTVSGGAMHMLMQYEPSGENGAGWYTAGMMIDAAYGSIDQRITVRFRIVESGASAHHIIPMSFPDGYPWPQGGEEDYCESGSLTDCDTFLHYGSTATTQIDQPYTIDLSQWHVFRIERRNHTVTTYWDDLTTPVWSYAGDATSVPDTIKRVVLQQECHSSGCPTGTTGTEDIQIDWITIENPS